MSTAQRHKGQSVSVALAKKRDFKRGPRKGNCFVCGIPGHCAKTVGGRRQHNAASAMRKVTSTGHAGDKEMDASLSQRQGVQH